MMNVRGEEKWTEQNAAGGLLQHIFFNPGICFCLPWEFGNVSANMTGQWAHTKTQGIWGGAAVPIREKRRVESGRDQWKEVLAWNLIVCVCVFWKEGVNTWIRARTIAVKSNLVPFLFQREWSNSHPLPFPETFSSFRPGVGTLQAQHRNNWRKNKQWSAYVTFRSEEEDEVNRGQHFFFSVRLLLSLWSTIYHILASVKHCWAYLQTPLLLCWAGPQPF